MIAKLRPGQEVTPALLNQVIDAVNAAHVTSSDFPLERSAAGTKLKMPRREQDFYAEIIEPLDDDGKPIRPRWQLDEIRMQEYEWQEVWLPPPRVTDDYVETLFKVKPEGRHSHYDATSGKLWDPAYELGGNLHVPIGTLVRMRVYDPTISLVHPEEPGGGLLNRGFIRRYVFHYVQQDQLLLAEALTDWEENGTYPEGNPRIRCYQMIADPETEPTPTEPHPKIATGEAIWVELPRERDGGDSEDEDSAHSTDPALYAGDRLYYSVDDQERLICQSPYLHMGKIGEIRMLGLTSTGDPADEIPVGWHECDGTTKTGNAGGILLADFTRDYAPVGGSANKYGAIPIHRSSDFSVGAETLEYIFDTLGSAVIAELPITVDTWVDTTTVDAHKHEFKCAQGEYPLETVLFYQRYK